MCIYVGKRGKSSVTLTFSWRHQWRVDVVVGVDASDATQSIVDP